MSRQEWFNVAAVAMATALLAAAVMLPASLDAEGDKPAVAIPSLAGGALAMPDLGGNLVGTTVRTPGEPVTIRLALTADKRHAGTAVPVKVAVLRYDESMSSMMRRVPAPVSEQPTPVQVTEADASLTVGEDGTASCDLALAVRWTREDAATPALPNNARGKLKTAVFSRYVLAISSPMASQPRALVAPNGIASRTAASLHPAAAIPPTSQPDRSAR